MVFASLFPLGLLQLYHSVSAGDLDARSLNFLSNHTNALLEWLRLPGDVLFQFAGRNAAHSLSLLAGRAPHMNGRMPGGARNRTAYCSLKFRKRNPAHDLRSAH